MADYLSIDGENLADHTFRVTPAPVENAVAAARPRALLRAWVHGDHAERPTRGELRAWADHVLADRDEAVAALEAATRRARNAERERDASRAKCVSPHTGPDCGPDCPADDRPTVQEWELLRKQYDRQWTECMALIKERDEARRERDEARRQPRTVGGALAAAYEAAEAERNRYAHENRKLREEVAVLRPALRAAETRLAELVAAGRRVTPADADTVYVVLRLLDGRAEALVVDVWDETDDGVVTVEAHRVRGGDK